MERLFANRNWTDDHGGCWNCVLFVIKKGLYFVTTGISQNSIAGKLWKWLFGDGEQSFNGDCNLLFNLTMLRLLGEDGVAAITIVLYGQFLFTSMYLGFSMGVAPVFSFNYGDKNYDQLKRIYKICMYFITVSSIVILVMALVFAEPIVGIFSGRDSRTYEIAADGFFLFSFNYIFAGINIFASAMFTAFGDGKRSAIISFCRTFIFIVVEYPCTAIGDGGDGCLAVCSAGGICDAVHICRLL